MDRKEQNLRRKNDLYQAFKRAEGLQRVTSLLANAKSKKKAADIILNEGLSILGAQNGEVDLLANDQTFYVFAHKGYPQDFLKKWPTLPKIIPTDTPLITTEVLQNKKPYFIPDIDSLSRKYKVGKSFFKTTGAKSAAFLPLKNKTKIIGVLVFTFNVKQEFNKQEKVFMKTLTNQCTHTFERLTAQESLKKSLNQLQKMDKKKDDFIGIASHELKTPLTSIKLYLEVLSRELNKSTDQQDNMKFLIKAQEQTDRLQRLVTDLLDVSRIQKGKLQFLFEDFRLDRLIEDTLDGVSLQHKIVLKKNEPLTIKGDKFRIYQVLTNLLTNANKYSPKDKSIYISLKKSGEYALVSIQDFGIGISKNQQTQIFEKLYQIKNAAKKTYSGLGMGLYISKEIITQHGGTIWVESERNKGATFYFTLPLSVIS